MVQYTSAILDFHFLILIICCLLFNLTVWCPRNCGKIEEKRDRVWILNFFVVWNLGCNNLNFFILLLTLICWLVARLGKILWLSCSWEVRLLLPYNWFAPVSFDLLCHWFHEEILRLPVKPPPPWLIIVGSFSYLKFISAFNAGMAGIIVLKGNYAKEAFIQQFENNPLFHKYLIKKRNRFPCNTIQYAVTN